mgnify:FL=1
MNVLEENVSTVCIPRVENTITKEYVKKKFINLNIGRILSVQEFPLYKESDYKRIIIKIKWNYRNEITKKIQDRFSESGMVNIVYNTPWFWKVCPAR